MGIICLLGYALHLCNCFLLINFIYDSVGHILLHLFTVICFSNESQVHWPTTLNPFHEVIHSIVQLEVYTWTAFSKSVLGSSDRNLLVSGVLLSLGKSFMLQGLHNTDISLQLLHLLLLTFLKILITYYCSLLLWYNLSIQDLIWVTSKLTYTIQPFLCHFPIYFVFLNVIRTSSRPSLEIKFYYVFMK
jgi:hypothetical protein